MKCSLSENNNANNKHTLVWLLRISTFKLVVAFCKRLFTMTGDVSTNRRPVLKPLKHIRLSKGMSQDDVAEATGLTRQVISNLERGASHGYPQTWRRIADALGVTVDDLIKVPDTQKGAPPCSMLALLEQVGVETQYLALSPSELRDLYRESSYEDAVRISRAIAVERDAIDPLIARAELPPTGEERKMLRDRWRERYARCFAAGVGMGRAAEKEAARIRGAGDGARAEELSEEGEALALAVGGVT